jgi:hypothetical protein
MFMCKVVDTFSPAYVFARREEKRVAAELAERRKLILDAAAELLHSAEVLQSPTAYDLAIRLQEIA